MKHPIIRSVFAFALLISFIRLSNAQDTTAFGLDSLKVQHGLSPHLGDTVTLVFAFHSNITAPAHIHLTYHGAISPPDDSGEAETDSTIVVNSGFDYVYRLPLKLENYGGAMVEAYVATSSPYPGIKWEIGSHFSSDLTSSSFTVEYPGSTPTYDTIPVTIEHPDSMPLAHLHISGKVDYQDFGEITYDSTSGIYGFFSKGAYGDTVLLLFYKRDVSGRDSALTTNAFHPVSGCISGTHYCRCDTGGNFTFDFTANLTNWNDYVDVVVIPTKGNSASFIQTGSAYTFTGFPCGNRTTFTRAYSAIFSIGTNVTNISQTGVEIALNSDDGGILRHAEMSQEFDSVRPVGIVPSRINFYVVQITGVPGADHDGDFQTDYSPGVPGIEILDSRSTSDVVCHEWGHWLHDNYLTATYTPTTFNNVHATDFKEGFADFHQFCVRNYENKRYGDSTDWTIDNNEESPFGYPPFFGMSYYGYNTSACAFACFLWDVYDAYADTDFRSTRYTSSSHTADNDDVAEPTLIWEKISGLDTANAYTGDFKNVLKSSVDTSEAASIQKIYDYMYGDTTLSPSPMRPAQICNLNGIVDIFDSYRPYLWWNLQYYDTGEYYKNRPLGIHIYIPNDSGGWELYSTVPATTHTVWFAPGTDAHFKVSTFDTSGDAYGALTILDTSYGGSPKKADGGPAENTATLMTIHPNPATNEARICVPDIPAGTPVTMVVVNSAGEVVSTLYNATPDAELGLCCTLDCSKLPDGVYFARLWNDILGQSVKLVIQH